MNFITDMMILSVISLAIRNIISHEQIHTVRYVNMQDMNGH